MSEGISVDSPYFFGIETSDGFSDVNPNYQAEVADTKERPFWYLTFNEILTILCAILIPIAFGVYTGITFAQDQQQAEERRQFDSEQAEELRQQELYDKFLNNMYMLQKDGYLEEKASPWAFANAYHRAAHRQWDAPRKVEALQFLKEKQLIGRGRLFETRIANQSKDIISLNELNLDNVHLTSQTGSLNLLDLKYILFDQVSMINAKFEFVNLGDASFKSARLNNVKFDDSSLANTTFTSTELRGTNFGNSVLLGTQFSDCDLSVTTLTPNQIQQAVFYNTTMPNGSISIPSTAMPTTTLTNLTTAMQNSTLATPTIRTNVTETSMPITHGTTFILNRTMSTDWMKATSAHNFFISKYTKVMDDKTSRPQGTVTEDTTTGFHSVVTQNTTSAFQGTVPEDRTTGFHNAVTEDTTSGSQGTVTEDIGSSSENTVTEDANSGSQGTVTEDTAGVSQITVAEDTTSVSQGTGTEDIGSSSENTVTEDANSGSQGTVTDDTISGLHTAVMEDRISGFYSVVTKDTTSTIPGTVTEDTTSAMQGTDTEDTIHG